MIGWSRWLPIRDEVDLYPGIVVRTHPQLFLQPEYRQFSLHHVVHAVVVDAGGAGREFGVAVALPPRPTPRTSSTCPPP